jgi:hypothetical protein
MNMNTRVVKAFLVPVLVGVYLIMFWRSTSGMPLGGKGVPRLLIGVIALLIVAIVLREIAVLRRDTSGASAVPEAGPATGPASPAATPAPDALAGQNLSPENDFSDLETALETKTPPKVLGSIRPMVAIVVGLLLYWALISKLGAYPSTGLFVIGLSLALGYRKPVLIAVSAISCVIIVYAFIQIFTLPLPGIGWS